MDWINKTWIKKPLLWERTLRLRGCGLIEKMRGKVRNDIFSGYLPYKYAYFSPFLQQTARRMTVAVTQLNYKKINKQRTTKSQFHFLYFLYNNTLLAAKVF